MNMEDSRPQDSEMNLGMRLAGPRLFRYNPLPVRKPLYANSSLINFDSGALLIEFGFHDTYTINRSDLEYTPEGVPIIEVEPVTRIAITPDAAVLLYQQLQTILERLWPEQVEESQQLGT